MENKCFGNLPQCVCREVYELLLKQQREKDESHVANQRHAFQS